MKDNAGQSVPQPITSEALARLAHYVIVRRRLLGMYTRGAFARAAGVSARTLGDVERGERPVTAPVLARIEYTLGWAPGSADTVLAGGEPLVTLDRPMSWMLSARCTASPGR